ncbi:ribonuclease H-like domain-containing protein [Tanacetum coccineum]
MWKEKKWSKNSKENQYSNNSCFSGSIVHLVLQMTCSLLLIHSLSSARHSDAVKMCRPIGRPWTILADPVVKLYSLNNDSSNHSDSSHSHVSGENDDIIDIPDSGVDADNNGQIIHHERQCNQNLRRSSRVSVFPRNYNDFVVESKVKYGLEKFVGYANLDDENLCFVTELNKSHEPKTFLEASRYPHWADAMNKEMEALLRNDTWENVNQREGIEYEETFSPVVIDGYCPMLMNIICVWNDWPMFQLDIDNAFLYGDLDETVYMKPPQGYYDTECNKVCRLKKSLYGLKQAPRQWNAKLTGALIENGFNQSKSDYSLFTKSDNGVFLVLLVYVDDIIITGNNSSEIDKFKEFLRTKFMIKDLGNLKYFLGIEVINTDKGICLNQRKYVLDLLSDYGMLACKPARTPMISKLSVSNEESESDPLLDNVVDYQKLMGKLIYLTNTRPDISYAVHCLSQFMHAPLKSHLRSAFKILRYLKGSPGLGIHVTKTSGMFLKAYSDADWAKCVVTRKSVTGYCVFINDNLISWKSKKQNTISKSSSEAEYRALASVTSEVIWILKVLKDLGYNNLLPVSLYCDSKPAIKIAANPVFHERTKHLEIDLHFVREKILKGIVKTFKVDSANQIADILTKGLDTIQHDKLVTESDNTSASTSDFVRSTAMDKLHVWKADIPRTLEITESEIDSLKNELKLLIPDVGGSCPSPAATCSFPTDSSGKNTEEHSGPTEKADEYEAKVWKYSNKLN